MNLKLIYTYITFVIISIILAFFVWIIPKKSYNKQEYNLHNYIDIQELSFKDGGKGFLSFNSSSEVVCLYIVFQGGSSLEPLDKKGSVNILSSMLLTNKDIKKLLDIHSISIDISVDIDKIVFNILSTKNNLHNMFHVLSLILNNSDFNSKDFDIIKDNALLNIKLATHYTSIQGINELYKILFNQDKRFYNNRGTKESIAKLSISDLIKVKNTVLTKNNVIVGASGNITKNDLEKELNIVFANLSSSHFINFNNHIRITNKFCNIPVSNSTNSDIYIAIPLPDFSNQTMLTADLVNKYLGSGFNSLLVEEVRVKRGLAYTIGSQIINTLYGSFWLIKVTTENKNAIETIDVIKRVLTQLKQNDINNNDIKRIKKYMKNSFLLNFKDNQSIAAELTEAALLNYDKNYIYNLNENVNNITKEEITDIINEYINLNDLVIVVSGAKI